LFRSHSHGCYHNNLQEEEQFQYLGGAQHLGEAASGMWSKPTVRRKTKIVCTIGPSTNTREMIWKLAEAGMNVARMNMSHGDHASHQKVIDLVKEYNAQSKDNVIAIMLDTKVCTYIYASSCYIDFVLWVFFHASQKAGLILRGVVVVVTFV